MNAHPDVLEAHGSRNAGLVAPEVAAGDRGVVRQAGVHEVALVLLLVRVREPVRGDVAVVVVVARPESGRRSERGSGSEGGDEKGKLHD